MDIRITVAYYSLNLLDIDDLPEIAVELLMSGLDSPSLAILAGESKPNPFEVRTLFEKALRELDIEIPAPADAANTLMLDCCRKISSGTISPYDGAKRILDDVYYKLEDPEEYRSFIGFVSEFDDFSDNTRQEYYGEEYCAKVRSDIQERIRQEAERVLSSNRHQSDTKTGGF